MPHTLPYVIAKDFAGEIDAVGDDAEGLEVGDRTFGAVMKEALGAGSFAGYVTVPAARGKPQQTMA